MCLTGKDHCIETFFSLSLSFHHCFTLIFIYIYIYIYIYIAVTNRTNGEAWEPFKMHCSCGKLGALDENVFYLVFGSSVSYFHQFLDFTSDLFPQGYRLKFVVWPVHATYLCLPQPSCGIPVYVSKYRFWSFLLCITEWHRRQLQTLRIQSQC